MTNTNRAGPGDAVRDASAALPPGCREGFGRLVRLIKARANKFQILIIDCRDERLRYRLVDTLYEVLEVAGVHSVQLELTSSTPDFSALEFGLIELARANAVIHIVGGSSWFDAARWDSFNIRRDAIAHQVKASLVFWLDPESIADLARIAIDLWAWRGAVVTFGPGLGIEVNRDVLTRFRAED